jgi:hypothetical protein
VSYGTISKAPALGTGRATDKEYCVPVESSPSAMNMAAVSDA